MWVGLKETCLLFLSVEARFLRRLLEDRGHRVVSAVCDPLRMGRQLRGRRRGRRVATQGELCVSGTRDAKAVLWSSKRQGRHPSRRKEEAKSL